MIVAGTSLVLVLLATGKVRTTFISRPMGIAGFARLDLGSWRGIESGTVRILNLGAQRAGR
jgi:hypothetical protein